MSFSRIIFSSLLVQAEDVELMPQKEIAEAPALGPITEEQLNDLLGEEMYLGTLDLRGNKVVPNLDKSKKEKIDRIALPQPNSSSGEVLFKLDISLMAY